jgi:hypothetical protein
MLAKSTPANLNAVLDDQRLHFLQVYLETGSAEKAYGIAYMDWTGDEHAKNRAFKAYREGNALLNSAEIQDFLSARREESRRLAIGVLPDVVKRVVEIVRDPKARLTAVLSAARLISDMAGLTEPPDDRRMQLIVNNMASVHPVPDILTHEQLTQQSTIHALPPYESPIEADFTLPGPLESQKGAPDAQKGSEEHENDPQKGCESQKDGQEVQVARI